MTNNADLKYRPLLCGVSILNARIKEPGTLGYLGRDTDGNTWLISAYHVLCNSDLSPYTADEPIFQPAAEFDPFQIAFTRSAKADRTLDCAAALLHPGIAAINSQAGLGPVGAPKSPSVGMRVSKSGFATGVTEGIVTEIIGDAIRIEADPAFDPDYVLSAAGDSGSLWLEQNTRAPVALHRGHSTPQRADALNIQTVLATLGLTPI
jgi:hypothetical protein